MNRPPQDNGEYQVPHSIPSSLHFVSSTNQTTLSDGSDITSDSSDAVETTYDSGDDGDSFYNEFQAMARGTRGRQCSSIKTGELQKHNKKNKGSKFRERMSSMNPFRKELLSFQNTHGSPRRSLFMPASPLRKKAAWKGNTKPPKDESPIVGARRKSRAEARMTLEHDLNDRVENRHSGAFKTISENSNNNDSGRPARRYSMPSLGSANFSPLCLEAETPNQAKVSTKMIRKL